MEEQEMCCLPIHGNTLFSLFTAGSCHLLLFLVHSLAQHTIEQKNLHVRKVFNRLKVESHKKSIFSSFIFELKKKRKKLCKIADNNGDDEKNCRTIEICYERMLSPLRATPPSDPNCDHMAFGLL